MAKKAKAKAKKIVSITARRREAKELAKFIDPSRAIRRWLHRVLRSA